MKILVTGGTGYIGSHTVVELMQAGHQAVIVDNLSNSSTMVLDGLEKIIGKRPAFEHVDCRDYDMLNMVFNKYPEIEGVIHFAASKAVGESVSRPLLYYRNNLVSLMNILDLMIKHGVGNIVFSSSCTVYGQPAKLPVDENSPIQPALSPYGNTKQVCEEIIRDTVYAYPQLHAILLRYFNPIGAHESAEIGELPLGVPQNLIPYVTQTALGIRDKLKVFGGDYNTPDGTCIRDYINVCDLAKAHVSAVERMAHSKCKKPVEVFNIGTGNGTSVLEVIKAFKEATGVDIPYEITPRREGDIEKVWADASLANRELGWKAEKNLQETLLSAYKWEKKYREE